MQLKAKFLMNRVVQKNGSPGLIVSIPLPKLSKGSIIAINNVKKIYVAF